MKLRQYLNEAVIKPNPKELKMIKDVLYKKWEEFQKKKNKSVKDISDLMWNATKEVTNKMKDVKFTFSDINDPNRHGSAQMGYPSHFLNIFYNKNETFEAWDTDDEFNFKMWLNPIMSYIEHELVHIEQYRRIGNEKDPVKAVNILNLQRTKNDKSYMDQRDAYLNYSLEVMAHAKSVDVELSWMDKDELLQNLKSDEGQNELALDSKSFDAYYVGIKDKYPKTWKKFIKYLTMYVQKRK